MSEAQSLESPGGRDARPPDGGLRSNSLGLVGTIALTAAYMAPAGSLIALFGPIVTRTGPAAAFVMLLGLLVTLPSAISFGLLAREIPSAGGASAWAQQALGPTAGAWVGLTTAGYYILTVFFPPIVFGQLLNSLLGQLSVDGNLWTWLAGVLISLVIAGLSTYRGLAVSSAFAFAMLLVQLVVMSAFAVSAAYAPHDSAAVTSLYTPSAAPGGWGAILLALPLVLLGMACDAATPASEETRDARRTIPLAIILTLVVVGAWNVVAFGAITLVAPADELIRVCSQATENAVPELAGRVWGRGRLFITLVGMAGMIGALVPCATAASRLLYSLGRDGLLPRRLGTAHPVRGTPWLALHVVFGLTLMATVPLSFRLDPGQTLGWWGNIVGWFIIVVYFSVNLCNIVYFRRFKRASFSVFWNLLVPCVAMAAQLWVVYSVLVVGLWKDGRVGRSAQGVIVLSAVATAVYVLCCPHSQQARLSAQGDQIAPKGPDKPAQGNALGTEGPMNPEP